MPDDQVLKSLNKRLNTLDQNFDSTKEIIPKGENDPLNSVLDNKVKPAIDIENKLDCDKENINCNKCQTYKEEVRYLTEKNASLRDELLNKTEDLLLKNEEVSITNNKIHYLQQEIDKNKIVLREVQELNVEWQKTAIVKYNNLLEIQKAAIDAPQVSQGGANFPPVGYITEDESEIHIGRGYYLSMQAWYLALHVPNRRHITFAKNILVSLCGYDYLSNTTISGKGSNRNQQTKKPQKQLDPKIILAVKDIYTYYLVKEKKLTSEDAEIEASKVHRHISKKIASIKDAKIKAFTERPRKQLLGNTETTSSTATTPGSEEASTSVDALVPDNAEELDVLVSDNDEQMLFYIKENSLIDAESDGESENDNSEDSVNEEVKDPLLDV